MSSRFHTMLKTGTSLRFVLIGSIVFLASGCAATTIENFPNTDRVVERADFLDRHPIPSPADYQEAVQGRVGELLGQPLSLSAAMEIAMLNTPKLPVSSSRNRIM